MRMARLTALLIFVLGCRSPTPGLSAPASSRAILHVLGDANPDSMPASCRVHGGASPVAWAPPRWTWSKHPDRSLDSLAAGRLLIHLVAASNGESLQSGALDLTSKSPGRPIRGYVSGGWAHFQAPAGRYSLHIRSIGFGEAILDSLDFRRGYADTVHLAVG